MSTTTRALNTAAALATAVAMAALLSTGHLLDSPDDLQTRIATTRATIDAQREAQRQARFERAARRMCGGDNAAFVMLADNAIQCLTHQGRKTITAKVAL